ncbi:MAG: RecQ family ATP-dependent DNA helicase [Thermoflavifilum sp.]|nr:RecQ family ATP-dependent DNA helicase [Thermoflavifilum sp.]
MDPVTDFRRQAYHLLRQYWGYETFRSPQLSVMEALVAGQDVLAVLPTGSGKSLCFQLPALYFPRGALIISPLIALMNDQVAGAREKGIPATAIHSGMDPAQLGFVLDQLAAGAYRLVYVSPERLRSARFLEALANWNFDFVAVDEAHCISQWGHEFRPAYLEIASLRELYPQRPILAVTATATRQVREDIVRQLRMQHPVEIVSSFFRENIHYSVVHTEDKFHVLLDLIRTHPGSKLVYCRDRRTTVQLARALGEQGMAAAAYHAGLDYALREQRQQDWVNDRVETMICTNAFGMGIHKDNVRMVVHFHMPESLEAYFQETGRAGRDGLPAKAIVLVGLHDVEQLESWVLSRYPDAETVRGVYASLMNFLQIPAGSGSGRAFDFYLPAFCQRFGYRPALVHAVLRILEWEGWLYRTDAIVHPPRIQIMIRRDELIHIQHIHPLETALVEILLRLYPGIAEVPVVVDERQIAKHAGAPQPQVVDLLWQMHQRGWIKYQSSYESPQLIFLADRPPAATLFIRAETTHFLKQNALERLEQVRQYLDAACCRIRVAAGYFGEDTRQDCGCCDICEQKRQELSDDARLEDILARILELLRKPSTPKEIYQALPGMDKNRIQQVLDHLLAEAYIGMDASGRLRLYNSSSRSNIRMAD